MVLIFSTLATARLVYISNFLFDTLMGTTSSITTSHDAFNAHEGVKINYSQEEFEGIFLTAACHKLLFETDIKPQQILPFEYMGNIAFFETADSDFPFDIFAASFYLISRYEEYFPYEEDMYGRYPHEDSVAYKLNFLQIPIINIWANYLAEIIQKKFPLFKPVTTSFSFLPTYDIDIAYSYKHKGFARNVGGAIKHPSFERFKVLLGLEKDPYDAYDWLDKLHEENQLEPIYFFLVAARNGVYDKNILPYKKAMKLLIKNHAEKYSVGIHPSWQSFKNGDVLMNEIGSLETISETTITASRHHYIHFKVPDTYRRLLQYNIINDYTMGYGSINGFRASVATPFYWFDIEKNETINLLVHPFCFMEANSYYEQKYTPQQAYDELSHYTDICKKVNGKLITIWHNNFLGFGKEFAQWKHIYSKFILNLKK
ncbi:hypothetical protein BH11BAC3_BH11BAC3_23410 [soil metagenome]